MEMEVEEEDTGPGTLNVRNFLAARVQEINSLSVQIGSSGAPSSKGLAFQHVPKHMRRRAVSHNVKRLPHRLRQIHTKQIEKSSGSQSKKPKPPSRKHRRRKANLLEDYNRRQRNHKWLETHIWHAKRFHMHQRWNWMIPYAPTDKGYRALYRSARSHCAIRDISFLSCLQLSGPFELISSKISSSFAPSNCNSLSVSSKMYTTGSREGSLYFYRKGTYPYGYIGKVKFYLGKNLESIFLWVHPAHKTVIVEELCMEFELEEELKINVNKMEVDHEIEQKLSIDEIKLLPKKLTDRPTWSNASKQLVLTDMEGVFSRIRLYGPKSTRTLKNILEVILPEASKIDKSKKSCWWMEHYCNKDVAETLETQRKVWAWIKTFSQVPCHSIIPLTVRDPRVLLPSNRTPIEYDGPDKLLNENAEGVETDEEDGDENLDAMLKAFEMCTADVPLLSTKIRTQVVHEKMSDAEFSKRRAELLIPGSQIHLGMDENQIPVMLIHRPSTAKSNFQNGGWDLILPAGWTMQFWVALSYRAARACGYRDGVHFEFEAGSIHVGNEDAFYLPPDTPAGKIESEESGAELKTKFFKLPQAKRANYIKLGCPFPFEIIWPKLLSFTASDSEKTRDQFYVLRDCSVLKKLSSFVNSKFVIQEEITNVIAEIPDKNNCLVGIRLVTVGKGVINMNAVICLPTEADLELYKPIACLEDDPYLEQPKLDDSKDREQRDELWQNHKKLMTHLAQKRRKLSKKSDEGIGFGSIGEELKKYDSTSVVEEYNLKVNASWLPDSDSALKTMIRSPFGFVTFANECYSVARCAGIGYCSLSGLTKWFIETKGTWNSHNLVLYRNCKDSWIYRFARLEICELS